MSICEIFPDDPSCAVAVVDEPVVDEPTAVGADDATMADEEPAMVEEGEEGADEMPMEKMDDGAWKKWLGGVGKEQGTLELAGRDPMGAQLGYLITAGTMSFYLLADQFLWHDDDAYKAGEFTKGDTNWWSMGHAIEHWAALSIMTVAFITQALALAGIATDINGMVWGYGVGLALPILETIATAILYYGYDVAHVARKDSKTSAAAVVNAGAT